MKFHRSATTAFLASVLAVALSPLPVSAQVPMDGSPGGVEKMQQAFFIEHVQENVKQNFKKGMIERALHQMGAREKFGKNQELAERGSLFDSEGKEIKANKNVGEQIIDPRTPKGFGNPIFRKLHKEQNARVNDMLTEEEQAALAKLKWQKGRDVQEEAKSEMEIGTGWIPVFGRGSLRGMDKYRPEFMALMWVSPNQIIRRSCPSCDGEFKDVYYRRLTRDYNRNLLAMMGWEGTFDYLVYKNTKNEAGVDFMLYSTYEDAIGMTNPWKYVRPDPLYPTNRPKVGFPANSGPTGHDDDNMNRDNKEQPDYAFYVEVSNWKPTSASYLFDISGKRNGKDIEGKANDNWDIDLATSQHKLSLFVCSDCVEGRQFVYYKRISDTPTTKIAYHLMESFEPFGKEGHEFGVDFEIYSSYEDAIAGTNKWEYCEPHDKDTVGFPGNCRPRVADPHIPGQYIRMSESGGTRMSGSGEGILDTCWYVEKGVPPPDPEEWMVEDGDMEGFLFGEEAGPTEVCLEEGAAQPNDLGDGALIPLSDLPAQTYYHTLTWYANEFDTYDGSRDVCTSRGFELCPREVICPNGPGGGAIGSGAPAEAWVPTIDEHNMWIEVNANNPSNACMEYEDLYGIEPVWGLYGGEITSGSYTSETTHVACCAIAEKEVYDPHRGYYDVRGCGKCNDYCFWMSSDGTEFDPDYLPGVDPWHSPIAYDSAGNVKGYFTCVPSGSDSFELSTDLTALKDNKGLTSFKPRKCAAAGADAPTPRSEEYLGCFKDQFPSALPQLIGRGQRIPYGQCADACRSLNYHFFGRGGNGECRCGGLALDDLTYERYGRIEYGEDGMCQCDASYIGAGVNCVYRLVGQFDAAKARKQDECAHLPTQDKRKQCYIACRDANQDILNQLMCKMLKIEGRNHLNKEIAKRYEQGGKQLHMLGRDSPTGGGTF